MNQFFASGGKSIGAYICVILTEKLLNSSQLGTH